MKSHPNYGEALTRSALQRAAMALVLLLAAALLAPPRAHAQSVVLDPSNNFTLVGGQQPSTGTVLIFTDAGEADLSGLLAAAPFAAAGTTVDLIATFQAIVQVPAGVDAGFGLVINDATNNRLAVAELILVNGVPHIGLLGAGGRSELPTYPVFVQADWSAAPLTIHLRRWADGSFELLSLNGAPLGQPAVLSAAQLPNSPWSFDSVGVGAFSPSAKVTAVLTEFRAFAVTPIPEPENYAMLLAGLGLLGFAARRRKLKEAAAA